MHIILDDKLNPWFCGKDVALILEYKDTKKAIVDNVDSDDKITLGRLLQDKQREGSAAPSESYTYNQLQKMYINESGLYSMIMRSKMESAKKFKSWVTSEVLPSIRKSGIYSIEQYNKLESKYSSEVLRNRQLEEALGRRKAMKYKSGNLVYIVTNESMKDFFKFGNTKNLTNRIGMFQTSAPTPYIPEKTWYTNHFKLIESIVLALMFENRKREWYNNDVKDKVINLVNELHKLFESTVPTQADVPSTNDVQIEIEDVNHHKKKSFPDGRECTVCKEIKSADNFYLRGDTDENILRSVCKQCSYKASVQLKKELAKNPLHGKKVCETCKKILQLYLFFEFDDHKYSDECKVCYALKNPNVKQCNKCRKILEFPAFAVDRTKDSGYSTICRRCKGDAEIVRRKITKEQNINYTAVCEICNKTVTKLNLKNHQKSIRCRAHRKPTSSESVATTIDARHNIISV